MRFVLPPLLRACDHVLLVDNNSTTAPGRPRAVAAEHGLAAKFTLKEYPFDVARAGAEHLAVPERCVHSLAYFYNWCFSHVRTRYTWKWDGDMVLTTEGEVSMADLSWQVGTADAVIRFPRHGLYIESDQARFLDLGLRNIEEWGFPMTPGLRLLQGTGVGDPYDARRDPACSRSPGPGVELKYLDGDEFAHWTNPESFATSVRNRRKRREWLVFNALNDGEIPEGVIEINAPDGEHVVDYVTHDLAAACPAAVRRRRPRSRQLHLRA